MQKEIKNNLYAKFINELCKKYIRKEFKVFDCGCGDGFHTSILKRYSDNVVGGDFDNRTKREYGVVFRKIVINKYGQEGEFDLVTSFDVIEHVKNDQKFINELIRVLKPGGLLIIGTPNRKRLSNLINSIFYGKIKYPRNFGYHYESGGDIIHLREYTIEDLNYLVKKAKNAKVVKIYSSFFGIYLPKIGALGFKKLEMILLKKYCQHLFIVLKKV